MSGGVILLFVLMLAVVVVLALGFILMFKGGKLNEKYSSKLMFARVALQAAAIGLIGLLAFAANNN
jgi:hypothetical protein